MSEAWIGVVGAIGGVIVSQTFSLMQEWTRARREDRHRHTDAKRAAYARLLGIVGDAEVTRQGFAPGHELALRLSALLGEIRLLGSPEVCSAAEAVVVQVAALQKASTDGIEGPALELYQRCRTFQDAARADLTRGTLR